MIRVCDVMTDVVEVLQMGDTLDVAEELMRTSGIRHLPVVDGQQRVIGLITQRKILASWISHGDPGHEKARAVAHDVPVEMLMDRDVVTTSPDAPALEAADVMSRHKYGCLPVVERGKLVGIVTEADFVRLARRFLAGDAGEARPRADGRP